MLMKGIIIKAISGFFYACCGQKIYECKARGNFRKSGISPVAGDRVEFTAIDEDHGVIEKVLLRRNFLTRPLIANIDKLFIVSSYENPAPDLFMIDRLTAIARYNGIEPVIVFNKSDMGDFESIARIYTHAGFKTYTVSVLTGQGIEEIRGETVNCISSFTGNSGVGKSSILNALFENLNITTGEVSKKLGRGRHTTRHTQLYPDGHGGFIADTPGFSSIDPPADAYNFKLNLAKCFFDFRDYIDGCRFNSCSHTVEKGCSLIEAVNRGDVEKSRHESYAALWEELKNVSKWNSDGIM